MKRNVSKSFSVLLALALLLALVPSAHAEESALASASVDDIYVTPSASDGHLEFGKAGDVNTIFRRGVDGVDNADDKSSSPVSVADMIVKACDTMLTESQINNGELDYLSYVSVSGSQGAIYDGYNNEGDTGEGVAGVKKYYYSDSASNYLVRNIRFVPSSAFSGRALITYYGYYHYMDTTENAVKQGTFAGRIYVTVTKQVPGISYSSDGEPIRFAAEDFNTYSLAVTGRAFRYISFTPPPSSAGTMYYNYVDESIYDSEITSTSRFYRSNAPFMDSVYFVPEDDYATPKG